jgi:L-iditol 2-dehydrogenase
MKAAFLKSPKNIEIREIDIPLLNDDEVLVKTNIGGICGTDIAIYEGYRRVKMPLIIGHEVSGIVVKVGRSVTTLSIDDHVVLEPNYACGSCLSCRKGLANLCVNKKAVGVNYDGAFSEYFKAPEKYLWKIPNNVNFFEAALTEPLSCVLHALRNVNLLPEDNVLIIGGGAIGALAALILEQMGINVAIQDRSPLRTELLRKKGFNAFCTLYEEDSRQLDEFFSKEGADVILDAAGGEKDLQNAINFLKPGGSVLMMGLGTMECELPIHQVVRKEVSIKGALTYRGDFFEAIKILSKRKISFDRIITHILDFNEIEKAFEICKRKDRLKVMLRF